MTQLRCPYCGEYSPCIGWAVEETNLLQFHCNKCGLCHWIDPQNKILKVWKNPVPHVTGITGWSRWTEIHLDNIDKWLECPL